MLCVSTLSVQSNHSVNSDTKYSNYMKLWIIIMLWIITIFEILGSVKLHIGDSWGKMKTLALGHFHGETQTLGGQ